MLADLLDLCAYHRWANLRTLAAVLPLSPEQYARELGGSFPSLRATLHHLLLVDWVWLQRWQGTSPLGPPAEWDVSTPAALQAEWQAVEVAQTAFLRGLVESDVARVVEYRLLSGRAGAMPLGQLLHHVVNHGTYHRGQVATLLRQVGAPAVATDLLDYYQQLGPR